MPPLDVPLPEAFSQTQNLNTSEKPIPLVQDWWKQTEDKILKNLLAHIEKENLSLKQAQFRLLAARESAASLDYLPKLSATADAQYNRLIKGDFAINNMGFSTTSSAQQKTTGLYNLRLDSSWELPLWGQYSATTNIEKQNLVYAEADLAAVRANVIAEAIKLYSEMRGFQQQRATYEKILAAHQKISEYQSIKHKAGLITDSELSTAKRNILNAKNTLQTIIKNEITVRQQLAALTGKTKPEAQWETPTNIPNINLPKLGDTPIDVLRNRPDIRRAEALVILHANQLELAKVNLYPRMTISGSLSQLNNLTGSSLPGRTIQLSATPAITIPLFDWGKRLATAKVQDAKLSESAHAYQETVVKAMTEVESFLNAAHTAKQNKEHAFESAKLESKNQEHAELLFQQGLIDGIAFENSHVLARQAQITALQQHVEHINYIAALTKALGGGIPNPKNLTSE
jgi:NodT family efflux transporter outer membrane factor (OMF) lipoprotein